MGAVEHLVQNSSTWLETIEPGDRLLLYGPDHFRGTRCQQPAAAPLSAAAVPAGNGAVSHIKEHFSILSMSGAAVLADRKIGTIAQNIEELDHEQRQDLPLVNTDIQAVKSP